MIMDPLIVISLLVSAAIVLLIGEMLLPTHGLLGLLGGLCIVTLASVLGGFAGQLPPARIVPAMLAMRALEGVGFLLAVMPAPGLIRALAPPTSEKAALGLWGAYMPLGVALALLCGPALIARGGWSGWWWLLSLLSAAAALWVRAVVPPDRVSVAMAGNAGWADRLRATLGARGPWTVALAFAVYSSQWMAVIGFLPAIYATAGVPSHWSAVLTALAAGTNIVGNVAGGRWLQRGASPARLLAWGFAAMALGSLAAFGQWGSGPAAHTLPPALRYLAVCVFSLAGGMVPATLFMLSVRLAPGPSTVSTTVGLMQQASALGQFAAPPLVAWIAHRAGGWQWTWTVTLACSVVGMVLAARLPASARSASA